MLYDPPRDRAAASRMLMSELSAGALVKVTRRDEATGRETVFHGHVRNAQYDGVTGEMSLELTPKECYVSTDEHAYRSDHARGAAVDFGTDNEEEEQDTNMNAIVHYNTRNRMVDVSIEVGKDVFLTPDNEEVERKVGEEMPVYVSMPEEVLSAIKSASPRVI